MLTQGINKKPVQIAFVLDERLSREKRAILARNINILRRIAQIQVFSSELDEETLLKELESRTFQLVMVPWYRYLSWSRLEAFYGLTRASGPTVAGYFCEPILPYELGDSPKYLRTILFDFCHLESSEILVLVHALLFESSRWGISPLLSKDSPIYCENWYGGQGLGFRFDSIFDLPELSRLGWNSRNNSIRILLCALWGMIYEEGPGKKDALRAQSATKHPRAYFQIGISERCLAFRLRYSMPGWNAKDAVSSFWPSGQQSVSATQTLLTYSDFLRIYTILETQEIEVVAGLLQSAPAEKAQGKARTLWIDLIHSRLVTEMPDEVPHPSSKQLKPLTQVEKKNTLSTVDEKQGAMKDRLLLEAGIKIKKLRTLLAERDELIQELRKGGVGTARPTPPPDAENLLEGFQQRYFEARFKIREFEVQLSEMAQQGTTPEKVRALQEQMAVLTEREKTWIHKIGEILEIHRRSQSKAGG